VTRRGASDAARAVDARMESAGNFAIVAELTVTMARSRASASARVSLPPSRPRSCRLLSAPAPKTARSYEAPVY